MKNEDVLQPAREERNILHPIKVRNANCINHILHMNCLQKHIIEGKIEGVGRQGKRCKQVLGDLKEMRIYWKLKKGALDCNLWRTHFERGNGPVIRLCDNNGDDDALPTYYMQLGFP
jgi:hypothetical protein